MHQKALIILAKAPILGQVNTRLAPRLTPQQSYALHRAFIKDTLDRVIQLKGVKLWLGYYPRGHKAKLDGLLPTGIGLFCQQGKDLGERMKNALQRRLTQAKQVVIMGTDIPCLPIEYIQQAFWQLNSHDVVIGPALDGGYYLIGSRLIVPEIFGHMPWGTERVFELTCTRLEGLGYEYAILPRCFDVDRPEDLYRLNHYLSQNPHSLPATRRVMANCLPITQT